MIDLCVVQYKTEDKLMRLLACLQKTRADQFDDFHMYLANNDAVELGRPVGYEERSSKLTQCDNDNIGYAAACNQLASFGTGDIIGLLNADVWLKRDDLEHVQRRFDRYPEVAILGPKQLDEQGKITHAGIFGTLAEPKHRAWHRPDPGNINFKDLEECVTVSGSAYFIRRSVWDVLTNCPLYKEKHPDATGAFLPTPHYFEETFCSYHARAHGYRVFYDGGVTMGHSWHASSESNSDADRIKFKISQGIFREMCDHHGIQHD